MRYAHLLFILLIMSIAMSVKPLTIGHMQANLSISGFGVEGQKIYIPKTEGMQTVIGPVGINYSFDDYGNRYVVVYGNYDLEFQITVDSSRIAITQDTSFPGWTNESDYLGSSQLINSDNELIKSTAEQITSDATTNLAAISKLMLWVHGHITYDESYTNSTLSAIETLKIRKGVCDEFTNLYTAFARSVGIPTRIVVGLVYTGSRWRKHAWAESLVGDRWIPVDPTFAEMGQIDATHIKLYSAPTYISYMKTGSTQRLTVTSAEYSNYTLNIISNITVNDSIAPRDMFSVMVKVRNNDRIIVTPTYLLQASEGFQVLGDPRIVAIVYPGKEETISWTVVSPFGEKDKYYLGIVGPLVDKLVEVHIDRSLPVSSIPGLRIDEVYAEKIGDKAKITVFVENNGNVDFDNVEVKAYSKDLGLKMKYITLLVGERKEVEFEFQAIPGNHIFIVEAVTGNVTDQKQISLAVSSGESTKNESLFSGITKKSNTLFWVSIGIVVIIILFVLSVPALKGKKIPFKEQKKWERLLKLGKK